MLKKRHRAYRQKILLEGEQKTTETSQQIRDKHSLQAITGGMSEIATSSSKVEGLDKRDKALPRLEEDGSGVAINIDDISRDLDNFYKLQMRNRLQQGV